MRWFLFQLRIASGEGGSRAGEHRDLSEDRNEAGDEVARIAVEGHSREDQVVAGSRADGYQCAAAAPLAEATALRRGHGTKSRRRNTRKRRRFWAWGYHYCTLSVTVPVAVVEPDVPVTVMV